MPVPNNRLLQQRANAIRFAVNWQWTAIKMQHERLTARTFSPDDLVEAVVREHMRGVVDMDFFVIAVRRFLRVAIKAKKSGCDAAGTLKPIIRNFETHWDHIIDARNWLEHVDGQNAEGTLLPVHSSNGDWHFTRAGKNVDVNELFKAADELCKAICLVIEPYES